MNDYLFSAILGIVEGLTEFLPVSSTAHIRLAMTILRGQAILDDNFWKLFSVAIQLPAVIAVVIYFWPTIWRLIKSFFERDLGFGDYARHPITLILLATAVTGGPAKLLKHMIKDHLGSLYVIGSALIIGGIVMAIVDEIYGRRERKFVSDAEAAVAADQPVDPSVPASMFAGFTPPPQIPLTTRLEQMNWWQAVWIGLVQILSAVFPGTSRSMTTIAGGQIVGLTRAAALEFSFFLSIPIMFLATASDLKDSLTAPTSEKPNPDYIGRTLTSHDWTIMGIGSVVSFLVALMVIAWFMAWVRRRGFLPFAVYRVIIGTVVLFVAYRTSHPA